ncbi:4Fe4S-binding leucine-rich repeat protein [Fuscovulum blasticum]|uniref:4Fe4S-binding leucine-rich repeat protein n=1 Tax=Fuscovulum blasticum TaxID=1075 RepID=UPI003AAC8778
MRAISPSRNVPPSARCRAPACRSDPVPGGAAPVDWQGAALDCAACAFRDRLAPGQCSPGWACGRTAIPPGSSGFSC